MTNRFSSAISSQSWIAVGLAFVIGLLVGWLLIGWVLYPVSYTNADAWDLNPAAKAQYIAMVADSYGLTRDMNVAQQRLRGFDPTEVTSITQQLIQQRSQAGDGPGAVRLQNFARDYGRALGLNLAGTPRPATTPTPIPNPGGGAGILGVVGPAVVIAVLLMAAAAVGLLLFRRAGSAAPTATARRTTRTTETYPAAEVETGPMPPAPTSGPPPPVMTAPPPRAATVTQTTTPVAAPTPTRPAPRVAPVGKTLGTFAATYKFGDDNYDTAFTLETGRNEFLGECGMGISDTIGEGKPDKVTAFDLWLFDKTDVRTVTQILMSDFAYNDPTLRNKLAPKGDLALAEKGKHIILETATLRVDAEIVDLVYASTPGLPPNSHFQKLIVEMVPVQK